MHVCTNTNTNTVLIDAQFYICNLNIYKHIHIFTHMHADSLRNTQKIQPLQLSDITHRSV